MVAEPDVHPTGGIDLKPARSEALVLALFMILPTIVSVIALPMIEAQAEEQERDSRAIIRNWDTQLVFEFGPTKQEVNEMVDGVKKANQILYDSTEGQFRFRHIEMWTHGKNLNDPATQIKVLDTGPTYRANAARGGIAIQGTNVNLGKSDYGMKWNSTFGTMTIAHEWAHFALYLPDEYKDVDMGGYLVSVPWCNNCLMSNASNLVDDTEFCTVDNHNVTNPDAEAQSCWEQIKAHYASTTMPSVHSSIVQNGPFYPANEEVTFTIHFPDLYILESELTMTPPNPKEGDQVTLTAKVHNKDSLLVGDVIDVKFYDGAMTSDKLIGTKSMALSGAEVETASTTWTATGGYRNIIATADPNNVVLEWEDYSNNTVNRTFHVLAKPKISNSLRDVTGPEDKVMTFNLKGYESDIESTDSDLQWTVTSYDPNYVSSITGENSVNDVINVTPVQDISVTKTPVEFTLTDGDDMTATKRINITWTAVPDAPRGGVIQIENDVVYRTQSVKMTFNGSDPESQLTELTPLIELKASVDPTWVQLPATLDGTVWAATFTPAGTAKLGKYDIRAQLTDPEMNIGEFIYLNSTLEVLNGLATITDLDPSANIAYRGKPLNISVEGSDLEDDGEDLKVELHYKPTGSSEWAFAATFNKKTGNYVDGTWVVQFTAPAVTKIGNCDLRVRLNDTIGPGPWAYLNKTIQVKNSPPTVTRFMSDSEDVYRTRMVNMTIEGTDFETTNDKLTLTVEYSVGDTGDWSIIPTTQSKIIFDTQTKVWEMTSTPAKDADVGTYHLRAKLRDPDGDIGTTTELIGDLQVLNNLPKVKFTLKTSATTGEGMIFDAKDCSDVEDSYSVMKYEWDFKDGSAKSTKSRTTHAFSKPGNYEVTLKVTDRDGGSATYKTTITVTQSSVVGPGGALSMAVVGAIVAVVIVVVIIVVLLILKKKGMGPFKTT